MSSSFAKQRSLEKQRQIFSAAPPNVATGASAMRRDRASIPAAKAPLPPPMIRTASTMSKEL
ncbi:hypothetical protein AB0I02_41875 [Streptomyces phaeochromogenes]